jgi:plasmid stabilization system protein ParE
LNTTYTEEAVADIVEVIAYLHERNPTAAANLDAEIARCIERLAARNSRGLSRGYDLARSCEVGPCRRSASTASGILLNC